MKLSALGAGMKWPAQVKGGSHYRIKGETPWQVKGAAIAQEVWRPRHTILGYYRLTQNAVFLKIQISYPIE